MLTAMRTVLRHKILAATAATVVAGGVTAGFVVPALAASSPAASTPSPGTSGQAGGHSHRHHPVVALAMRLGRETMRETGLRRSTLVADLRAGRTLDQIAGAKAGAIVNAVVAKAQSRLDALVKAGKLSSAQEQERLARLRSEANAIMGMDLAPFLGHRGSAGSNGPSAAAATTTAL